MINYSSLIIVFRFITAPAFVGGCFVHPTNVVAIVGERVLLTCTTHEGGSIDSWRIGINILEKTAIYTAPAYKRDGTIKTPETLAKGYFVTHPADNETILHMNKTIFSQAGLYVCTCGLQGTAVTSVAVLDSEPKFTTNHTGVHGKPVTFICSVSFNASSDVYCELRMEDVSGSTAARRNESTLNNGLNACSLKYTIIANASSDQWYICNVTLSIKGDKIFSRVLNATVEWQSISSAADFLSTKGVREEQDEETSKKLAIGLSITIFAVVIIIAVVVYFIVCSQKRDRPTVSIPQCSMGQPADQSSRCPQKPTNRYDKNEIGSSIPKTPAASCHDDIQQDSKKPKENELIVVENDLYGVTPKQFDPSDGYLTEEPIYHGIK